MMVAGYMVVQAQNLNRFDVVIHEIMPDPSPPAGLPNSEFIELKNVSGNAVNLRNWKLSDGSSTAVINVNFILQPDSLVIICSNGAASSFAVFGSVIGVTNFPSLNNEGDIISLISSSGKTIHAIEYNVGWYNNAVKSEGGWSLEMMDAMNPCAGADNWKASTNVLGGTPGKENSVKAIVSDSDPPDLLRTFTVDSITIAILFDESLDSAVATSVGHYKFNKSMVVMQAMPVPPLFKRVDIKLASGLIENEVYDLTVADVTDCKGNSIGMMNSAKAGLPTNASPLDLVINEILFNPPPDGSDYVELYNRSKKIIDASTLLIASKNTLGALSTPEKFSESPFLIFPGDYVLISGSTPSMPDDKGIIVLLDQQGQVIDELSYDEKWHFRLITNTEGVSLERIDANAPTQNKDNWTSAASDAGFGTPGKRNSQVRSNSVLQGVISITPKVFSPDNDGRDDHCLITYQFPFPNFVANVTIFDAAGNAVRNLQQNATLSEKGFMRWDGLDNAGKPLLMGVYIVLTEVFNLEGKTVKFKNPVTLARRF